MNTGQNHTGNNTSNPPPRPALAWQGAAIMVALIIGFFVLREHWGHVFGFLPYLLLLACPLMHLFMHHGHGHGHHEDRDGARKE